MLLQRNFAAALLILSAAHAAQPTEKLRNENVAVTEYTLKPGEKMKFDTHAPAVTVRLAGERRGDVKFNAAGIANGGPSELRVVRIEFLGQGNNETWGAKGLAPNYQVLLENQYTRVYDIRIPAHGKEPQHTHHARVVVCLSGAKLRHLMPDGREEPSTLSTGEVAFRPGGTHIGENLGDTDLWVIAVEPK